ncbi:hypothetical protein ACX80E_16135 [Arthrobacter sp. TMN-49]
MPRIPESVLSEGPENEDGDPIWIRPAQEEMGAFPGDHYISYGRRNARIYPQTGHPVGKNPLPMVRHGYRLAIARWNEATEGLPDGGREEEATELSKDDLPMALTLIATHDVLEWVASMHDFLRAQGLYKTKLTPSMLDPELGPFVDGILGARHALHHAFAPVLGLVTVSATEYVAQNDRWELVGISSEHSRVRPRWAETIPEIEAKRQRQCFIDHLAGRDVAESFTMTTHYFWKHMGSPMEPYVGSGPADYPPPIQPPSSKWE